MAYMNQQKKAIIASKLKPVLKKYGVKGSLKVSNHSTIVLNVKSGKIDFKVDKTGIIHASIGKVSFTPEKLKENALEVINTIAKLKPASSKGTYFKSINMSSTMSPAISIDKSLISGL